MAVGSVISGGRSRDVGLTGAEEQGHIDVMILKLADRCLAGENLDSPDPVNTETQIRGQLNPSLPRRLVGKTAERDLQLLTGVHLVQEPGRPLLQELAIDGAFDSDVEMMVDQLPRDDVRLSVHRVERSACRKADI